MKRLEEYEVLTTETFYKCWHILDWINAHPNMSELDKEAIKATIMDALVYRKQIDPSKQSLDFENLAIIDNMNHYKYEKHPNISGIPLWMKEKFREKSLRITGGIPISMFLSKAPDKVLRYCVYDPNTAVSSIFEDATFYNSIYTSPTRGIRIEEVRPFVEVEIDKELYLVDTLTKRILKSSWFKKAYDFEVKSKQTISKMNRKRRKYYEESVSEHHSLSTLLPFLLPVLEFNSPEQAEQIYETEQSKKYFPDEWKKYEIYQEEAKSLPDEGYSFFKQMKSN